MLEICLYRFCIHIYLCSSGAPVLLCCGSVEPVLPLSSDDGNAAGSSIGPSGYVVVGRLSRCFRWCSCACTHSQFHLLISEFVHFTHVWHAAVSAPADLRLVDIDKDARVTEWATAAVARDGALIRPANGLLVDEVNRRQWTWLANQISYDCPQTSQTCVSYLVLHNSLLESRPDHCLCARLLAPTPYHFSVRSLHHTPPLAILDAFL